jgi:hypothetical protein
MERVVLLGNGLSISASAQFQMSKLTHLVRAELADAKIGSRSLLGVLKLAGKHLVPDQAPYRPTRNFEHLLGPLDRLADLFAGPLFEILAEVSDEDEAAKHVRETARNLYTRAVASVLRVIDQVRANDKPVRLTAEWILGETSPRDVVSIFTLNYDALLDRTLSRIASKPGCSWRLIDEFSRTSRRKISVGGQLSEALTLRASAPPRPNTVQLIHLHGSMHWLADNSTRPRIYRPKHIDDTQMATQYQAWADGSIGRFTPHVLLTDQKTRRVSTEPFASAYEALVAALRRADRVVIAGYGFGDKPLNAALADGCASRPPGSRWLVVNKQQQSRERRARIARRCARALKCTRDDFARCFEGLPGATRHDEFWS